MRPTNETRLKMSLAQKGKPRSWLLGSKRSDEVRKKMSLAQTGRKVSKKTRKKLSLAATGRKFSEETLQKLRGVNSHFWKGGKTFEEYGEGWTSSFRNSIRERDNFICIECGIHQDELVGLHKKLDVHHIDYNKLNLSLDNLVTLCRSCHIKTNFNRKYWVEYFKK